MMGRSHAWGWLEPGGNILLELIMDLGWILN